MWGRVLALSLVFGGCAFDESGSLRVGDADPGADSTTVTRDAAVTPPIDAPAAPACLDGDGDGFERALNGATCAIPADCDDADPRAHPQQEDFFDTPATGGGFDFDCSGAETQQDTRTGHKCRFELFVCRGSGWMTEIPKCGEFGVWHRCRADFLACNEVSIDTLRQPCR